MTHQDEPTLRDPERNNQPSKVGIPSEEEGAVGSDGAVTSKDKLLTLRDEDRSSREELAALLERCRALTAERDSLLEQLAERNLMASDIRQLQAIGRRQIFAINENRGAFEKLQSEYAATRFLMEQLVAEVHASREVGRGADKRTVELPRDAAPEFYVPVQPVRARDADVALQQAFRNSRLLRLARAFGLAKWSLDPSTDLAQAAQNSRLLKLARKFRLALWSARL